MTLLKKRMRMRRRKKVRRHLHLLVFATILEGAGLSD
jgi:hypothetical protein